MAAVNEGYIVGDDEKRPRSPSAMRNINAIDLEIDYSVARNMPIVLASLAATVGAFMMGMGVGWASPAQPQLQHVNGTKVYENCTHWDSPWCISLDNEEMSWVGSLFPLGALIGALTGGFLMDILGRRKYLIILGCPFLVGWLLVILAVHPSMLYIGRLISGYGAGGSSVAGPTYVGEISTPKMRGVLGFFFQLMCTLAVLFASILGLFLQWRVVGAISGAVTFILVGSMLAVPESPYYLAKNGRSSEAQKALQWFRGPAYNTRDEMAQMEERVKIELAMSARFSDLLKPWALKPLIVVVLLMVFQQCAGINAALFNAVAIFQSAGSTMDPLVSSVLVNLVLFLVTIVSAGLVVRVGRRTLFLLSQAVMCVAMFALGAFFYIQQNDPETAESLGWLPLVSFIVFIAAFSLGAGPLPWMMFSEILPVKVRGPGGSVATFTNWFLAFLITKTFVQMQEGLTEAGAFWFFGVFCFVAVFFSIFFLPETKDKTPEQIQAFFGTLPPSKSVPDFVVTQDSQADLLQAS